MVFLSIIFSNFVLCYPSSSPILCSVIHGMGIHGTRQVPLCNDSAQYITSTKRILTLTHNIQYALYMVGKRIYFNIFLRVSCKCKIHYANANKTFSKTSKTSVFPLSSTIHPFCTPPASYPSET